MHPDAPSARRPGRSWTIRVVGHRDRTASVTCSSPCSMPPRSRDIAALRRFAEAHAGAHARAAAVRHDAACSCRRERCALHEDTRVACAGAVVLVLRHDPSVGQVWTLSEVCAACAPLLPHTRVLSRATPPPPRAPETTAETATGPTAPMAPTGPTGPTGREAHGGRPASSGPTTPTVGPPRLVPGGFSAPSSGGGAGPERGAGRRRGVGGRRGRAEAEGGGL
ncbi:hypothetical protein [Streptomyces sp. yr375]|uniref:hypothetical protein n=1 Tax=Streptomyces sp. yr375 TaxID=1761906 RepID=UPI00210CEDE8|nr:hypothetical protein [Streptomyces sp. yr375]